MAEAASTANQKNPALVVEDEDLERLLDAVDSRTTHQELFHNHIADGFMALARERYRDPSSLERMGKLVYDNREQVKSQIQVRFGDAGIDGDDFTMRKFDPSTETVTTGTSKSKPDSTLRRRNVRKPSGSGGTSTLLESKREAAHVDMRNSFIAIPSAEMREAIKCFRLAVDQAIELANATSKVDALFERKE